MDEDTLFRIGSTTKTFTGTTIMQLVEQGILVLNAPVRTYLLTLKLADLTAANGGLLAKGEDISLTLAFYRDDHDLATDQNGQVHRADLIQGPDGRISWFRDGGRLFVRQG